MMYWRVLAFEYVFRQIGSEAAYQVANATRDDERRKFFESARKGKAVKMMSHKRLNIFCQYVKDREKILEDTINEVGEAKFEREIRNVWE